MDAGPARRRAASSSRTGIDPALRGKIGSQLRAVYDELRREPLPNDHVDLLLALRRKERDLKRKA